MKKFSLIVFSFLMICSCSKKEQKETISSPKVRPAKISSVKDFINTQGREFPAITRAKQDAQLGFRISGPLTVLDAEIGQSVQKNDVIAVVDPRDFEIDMQSKKATYEQAQSELARYKQLLEKESIPRNEYERKNAQFIMAKAAYEASTNALKDTKLRAPFDGYISEVLVENFEDIKAKQAIVSIVDLSGIEVKVSVPEALMLQSENFVGFSIQFDNDPSQVFDARLIEIGKTASPDGFPIILELTDQIDNTSSLLRAAGVNCKVIIEMAKDPEVNTISIPSTAVFQDSKTKMNMVWLVDRSSMTVSKRAVQVDGFISENMVSISSGLNFEDWIVIAGVHQMVDGEQIKELAKVK